MDIVKRLRKTINEKEDYFLSQWPNEEPKTKDSVRFEAADEIERLREAMVDIVYLIGKPECRQEIMDIAKPYAIKQLTLKGNKPHVYLLDEEKA